MAIIKCKMCGGDLELVPETTVCECEYCGTKQTVPSADNEKMLSLFHRAGKLLRACEFDKAFGVYESIVAEFPDEAEAYWGLVLCRFGIEYVDDPATGKKVPTCHRAGFESVEDDANFEQACENADPLARRVYRAEGRAIDELRERILEVSGKEEPYDIFISYKELAEDGERTEDSVLAQDIYDALTAKGYRVFFSRITLEDKLGVEYEPYIFAALNSAKVMLLVGMDYENLNAVWVKNEWSRFLMRMASDKEKVLIPCYKDMDPYDLPKEVRKLAAQDMGKVGAMQDLLRGVEKLIPLKNDEPAPAAPQPTVVSGGPNVTALQKRGVMALEDGEWDAAKDFFNQILNMDAESHDAYLGLAMAEAKLSDQDSFRHAYIDRRIHESGNQLRARKFANANQSEWWEELNTARTAADERKAENLRIAEERRNAAEKAEEERQRMEKERLAEMRRQYEEKAQEDATKVIAAVRAKRYEKGPPLETQIAEARQRAAELEQLCTSFGDLQAQVAQKKKEMQAREQKKCDLQKRRAALGIFAGKEKKQIDSELASLDEQATQVSEELSKLHEQLWGFEKKTQAEHEKEKAERSVFELEQMLIEQKSSKENRISYEAAMNLLQENFRVLEIASQKSADVLKSFLLSKYKKGTSVTFGRYPQRSGADPKPIKWKVLAIEGDRWLLISLKALDSKRYNKEKKDVTWETCTLRKWLNGEFLNATFTAEERKLIPTVTVTADKNPDHKTDQGNTTQDQIFLLSIQEANKYFSSDEARACEGTAYCYDGGATKFKKSGKCAWWLRSSGWDSWHTVFIYDDGSVVNQGDIVYSDTTAVRPALWIDLGD